MRITDDTTALFYLGCWIVGLLAFLLFGACALGAGALLRAKWKGQDTAPIWRVIKQEWNGTTDAPGRIGPEGSGP